MKNKHVCPGGRPGHRDQRHSADRGGRFGLEGQNLAKRGLQPAFSRRRRSAGGRKTGDRHSRRPNGAQSVFEVGDPQSLQSASGAQKDINHWILEAEKAAATEREKLDVRQLREGSADFFSQLDQIVEAKDSLEERKPKINQLIPVLEDKLLTPAQVYLDTNEEDIENSNAENLQMANRVVLGLFLLGICGPVSGLVAGFGIARGLRGRSCASACRSRTRPEN